MLSRKWSRAIGISLLAALLGAGLYLLFANGVFGPKSRDGMKGQIAPISTGQYKFNIPKEYFTRQFKDSPPPWGTPNNGWVETSSVVLGLTLPDFITRKETQQAWNCVAQELMCKDFLQILLSGGGGGTAYADTKRLLELKQAQAKWRSTPFDYGLKAYVYDGSNPKEMVKLYGVFFIGETADHEQFLIECDYSYERGLISDVGLCRTSFVIDRGILIRLLMHRKHLKDWEKIIAETTDLARTWRFLPHTIEENNTQSINNQIKGE